MAAAGPLHPPGSADVYGEDDLALLAERTADRLERPLTKSAARLLAKVAHGTPRRLIAMVRCARDVAVARSRPGCDTAQSLGRFTGSGAVHRIDANSGKDLGAVHVDGVALGGVDGEERDGLDAEGEADDRRIRGDGSRDGCSNRYRGDETQCRVAGQDEPIGGREEGAVEKPAQKHD
ncbi:MAG TPA: hypothetical protein ENK43_04785 [Planctomycetes bacterium]|nr:hypothetical protein [Planctomycetota bacterium]